ncbi:YJL057C [Saccharomyces arboricola H-6]|uniref:non-specific serine/threonine protein kinase n=1 Tax=Saccharomyces arboricola (strain H-6 / AS 2.3317 / CBS 10644) TaxID=1160507 RepID=J8Q6F9_SACAR|nr:YJL057C [Saccharomyces arboricola H-6]
MSLVPYEEGSLILDDPNSKSIVVVNPTSGTLSFYQQDNGNDDTEGNEDITASTSALDFSSGVHQYKNPIASYICPQCGTEINPDIINRRQLHRRASSGVESESSRLGIPENTIPLGLEFANSSFSRRYFQLLERNHRQYALQNDSHNKEGQFGKNKYFIPDDLFIPGYFRKFFKILSLLGNGARGSVYKVVHTIGNTELGVFALKKIPIGNDMDWFNKCIREVKALSSLTHKSANLITYNHVWLEMDSSVGFVRSVDGSQSDSQEEIPCIFILQQYCSGGNLEDCILKSVFHKFSDTESPEERKKKFRTRKKNHGKSEEIGLSTEQLVSIIRDIARGLHELHSIGLIHRDLKPSNCLLLTPFRNEGYQSVISQDEFFPSIVIGDLGESQLEGESRLGTGSTGTLEFTAPELIIQGRPQSSTLPSRSSHTYNEYTFASDMYSLGMICYFIVFGELPFEPQLDIIDLKVRIKNFRFDTESMIAKHQEMKLRPIDRRIFQLMDALLQPNNNTRPTAKAVEKTLDEVLVSSKPGKHFWKEDIDNTLNFSTISGLNENTNNFSDDYIGGDNVTLSLPAPEMDLSSVSSPKVNTYSAIDRTIQFCYKLVSIILTIIVFKFTKTGSWLSYMSLIILGMVFKSTTDERSKHARVLVLLAIIAALKKYIY